MVAWLEVRVDYNVVFEGTGKRDPKTGELLSNYEGIRTIRSFSSREEFDAWMAADPSFDEIIVALGVSDAEALRLANQTTGKARALAAIAEIGANPDPAFIRYQLTQAYWAASFGGQGEEFLVTLRELGYNITIV